MAQRVKNLTPIQETWVWSLGQEDPLNKGRATQSTILAWRIPWTEGPSRPQSMGSQRVGHNWATNAYTHTHTHTHTINAAQHSLSWEGKASTSPKELQRTPESAEVYWARSLVWERRCKWHRGGTAEQERVLQCSIRSQVLRGLGGTPAHRLLSRGGLSHPGQLQPTDR